MTEKTAKDKESWWLPRAIFGWTLTSFAGTIALGLASNVVGKVFAAGSKIKS